LNKQHRTIDKRWFSNWGLLNVAQGLGLDVPVLNTARKRMGNCQLTMMFGAY
jgi:hypothetical protein